MKTLRPLFFWVMMLSIVSMFSCGKEEYFMSEASVKKQLKGTWDLIPIPRTNPSQNWAFSDDKLNRVEAGVDHLGDFSVKTTISTRKVKLENFVQVSGQRDYNGTWDIVQLDDEYLVIATDNDGSTGLVELEFTKRK
jgi:hypothetical protein